MGIWRPLVSILLGSVVLAGGAPRLVAQEADPAGAFDAGLHEVEAQLDKQKWTQAAELLRALLAEHEGQPYVFLQRPTVADIFETCRFWATHEAPDPKDLVSGKLERYSASGGNIKVVYTPGHMQDFLVREAGKGDVPLDRPVQPKDFVLHSAPFVGPHTIRIDGVPYLVGSNLIPELYACRGWGLQEQIIECSFGVPNSRADNMRHYVLVPATLVLRYEGDIESLDYNAKPPARVGEVCDLRLQVTRTDVAGYFNGKKAVSGRKPASLFGQVGFKGLEGFEEIVIEGKAQRSWMQGRIDAAVQEMWRKFAATYDSTDDLPAWLVVTPNAWDVDFPADAYPGEPRPGQEKILQEVREAVRAGMTMVKTKEIEALPREAVTDAFRSFALSLLYQRREKWDEAFTHCMRVLELDPSFVPAEIMRFNLIDRREGTAAAIAAVREWLEAEPATPWAYPILVMLHLLDGDLDGAEAAVEQAVAQASYTKALDEVNRMLLKARRGPRWSESNECKTDHYHVVSDLDRATCIEAARVLETAADYFASHLGKKERPRERFRVYIFSGQAGYDRYLEGIAGMAPGGSLGVFISVLEQLVVWNVPDREEMFRTVRHEGLHQYVDGLMEDPPAWLNDGMAEYWEGAEFTAPDRFPARRDYVLLLNHPQTPWTPLKFLLYADHADFMRKAEVNYPESWALVHYLQHTTRENRALFADLLGRLCDGQSAREAIDGAFAGIDPKQLEQELRDYLRGLE